MRARRVRRTHEEAENGDCEAWRKSEWEFSPQRPSEKNCKKEVTVNTEDTTERSRRVSPENRGRWRSSCYRQEWFWCSGDSDGLVGAGLGAGRGQVQTVNRRLRSSTGSRQDTASRGGCDDLEVVRALARVCACVLVLHGRYTADAGI